MAKNNFYVNLILDDPQCNMISPGYEYNREKVGMPERKKWNPDNLIKLEEIVSDTMKERSQKELIETLDKKVLSLYIDCRNKGEDDIMLFIFKEYIKQSQTKDKTNIVSHAIGRHTIVTDNRYKRNEYIKEKTPTLDELLQHYTESLKKLLEGNTDKQRKNRLLNFESDITFDGLSRLMENEGQRYMYLYLDKVQSLSIEEQERINTLLYTRGGISYDRWIRLKINNGQGTWKTRYASVGHRVESPHDYSETTIRENELE